VRSAGHQSCDVGHVHHQQGANAIGDGPEAGEVQHTGIGTAAGDDQFGLVLFGQSLNLVVVDGLGSFVQAVGDEVVDLPREVHTGPVGQVATVVQLHAQDGVSLV